MLLPDTLAHCGAILVVLAICARSCVADLAALADAADAVSESSCHLSAPLPQGSHRWRANNTKHVFLPQDDAISCWNQTACNQTSWDASADLQSGDMLLLHVRHASNTNVTRPSDVTIQRVDSGHQQGCQSPGTDLLDVTPFVIKGDQVIAIYDKQLTEGANFFTVRCGDWGRVDCVRLRVNVKSNNCGDEENCSGKGVCYSNTSMEDFECQCCSGYIGPHCEEQDACFPSPCQNHGICVDISQGHEGSTFQCLCPYGFTGKTCEDSSDPCESGPCQHGGSCRSSNLTAQQFRCDCLPGYSGSLCQNNLDECASSPCGHGICVDQYDGYRCFCQPGFTGNQCQYEYNECESSPCLNGGTCTDHIGSYSCTCGRGYTGKRCHVKVDLCDPNPCSQHHYCVDKGNSYKCDCPKGFTGPDCLVPLRAACSANPCRNGGTCWSSVDSFYCACRPGFTGKICIDTVYVERVPSSAEVMDTSGQPIDLQMPITIHWDHLHNIYVAVGTLACAVLIVILTVTACYCRLHETYKFFMTVGLPTTPKRPEQKSNRSELDKEPLAPAHSFPSVETSEMYYALDFSDNQSSPLIQ